MLSSLKISFFLLFLIALAASLGSIIEQEQPSEFYYLTYLTNSNLFPRISADFILALGFDHLYQTWWFFFLLLLFAASLSGCTLTRQWPLLLGSKALFFKQAGKFANNLPFFIKFSNGAFFQESILLKIRKSFFHLYQKKKSFYGYRGLIGRISPILVHLSLLLILVGTAMGSLYGYKAQESLPKGELFNLQNLTRSGVLSKYPRINARVNDFWVNYNENKIRQFYSNLSILDNYGNEIEQKTILVNNPLHSSAIDFYQSDWNLLGVRLKKNSAVTHFELPLFLVNKNAKLWVTWVKYKEANYSLIVNQFKNTFLIYDKKGTFLKKGAIGDNFFNGLTLVEILPSTGLFIKADQSIALIYGGFALLMITTSLSYLPYSQIWGIQLHYFLFIGGCTNRGKIMAEIEFENSMRAIENKVFRKSIIIY